MYQASPSYLHRGHVTQPTTERRPTSTNGPSTPPNCLCLLWTYICLIIFFASEKWFAKLCHEAHCGLMLCNEQGDTPSSDWVGLLARALAWSWIKRQRSNFFHLQIIYWTWPTPSWSWPVKSFMSVWGREEPPGPWWLSRWLCYNIRVCQFLEAKGSRLS